MLSGEVATSWSTRKSRRTRAATTHRPDSIGQLAKPALFNTSHHRAGLPSVSRHGPVAHGSPDAAGRAEGIER